MPTVLTPKYFEVMNRLGMTRKCDVQTSDGWLLTIVRSKIDAH